MQQCDHHCQEHHPAPKCSHTCEVHGTTVQQPKPTLQLDENERQGLFELTCLVLLVIIVFGFIAAIAKRKGN